MIRVREGNAVRTPASALKNQWTQPEFASSE